MTDIQKRTALRSAVRKEMNEARVDYTTAFATVSTLHPELVPTSEPPGPHPAMLANDSGVTLSNSEKIQKLIREYCAERNLDLSRPNIYTLAFSQVLRAHPELQGHVPNRSFAGKMQQNLYAGKLTPPRKREGSSEDKAGQLGSDPHPSIRYNPVIEKQFAVQGRKRQG